MSEPDGDPTFEPVVHLDDLAHPTFPADAAALIEAAVSFADDVDLGREALVAQAVAETGLEDFGDDGWQERLDLLVRCLTDEAPLSPMGRITQSVLFGQLLRNRLLVADLLARHPEIRDVEISRPIIIAGLPRTGTTHLHNLLAADPALRTLPYWESLEPVLSPPSRPRSTPVPPIPAWPAPRSRSTSSTGPCPTSAACTR